MIKIQKLIILIDAEKFGNNTSGLIMMLLKKRKLKTATNIVVFSRNGHSEFLDIDNLGGQIKPIASAKRYKLYVSNNEKSIADDFTKDCLVMRFNEIPNDVETGFDQKVIKLFYKYFPKGNGSIASIGKRVQIYSSEWLLRKKNKKKKYRSKSKVISGLPFSFDTKTIKVCAGIGDNIWLLQKLINTGEKYRFILAGDNPKRGKQIFDLIPSICLESKYSGFGSNDVIKGTITNKIKLFKNITNDEFYLSVNEHLENGGHLEDFLPDLPTSYHLEFDTKKYVVKANSLLSKVKNRGERKNFRFVGIYGSCYSTLRHWNFWKEKEWAEFVQKIHDKHKDIAFIIIGADFDVDMNSNLMRELDKRNIPYVNMVGKELGVVIEAMKKMKHFVAFPSGLPILSTLIGTPTIMFYPLHLKKMMYGWVHPDEKKRQHYLALQFFNASVAEGYLLEELDKTKRIKNKGGKQNGLLKLNSSPPILGKHRKVFSEIDSKIIIANGGYRTGSTLCFAITVKLLEYYGIGDSVGGIPPKEIKKLISSKQTSDKWLVVKTHDWIPEKLISGVVQLYTYRNPFDVAASSIKGYVDKDTEDAIFEQLHINKKQIQDYALRNDTLIIDYDMFYGREGKMAHYIANFLGLPPVEKIFNQIQAELNITQVEKLTSGMDREQIDEKLQFRGEHISISKGKPYAWYEFLTMEIVQRVCKELA